MTVNTIVESALAQDPVTFKEQFDESLQAAIVRQGNQMREDILASFSRLAEEKDEDDEDEDEDDEDGDKKPLNKSKKKSEGDEDEDDEDEDEDEDDEDGDKKLDEQKIEIQVLDPRKAAKALTAIGLKASTDPKLNDGVVVNVTDKATARKLKTWMLDNGFDKVDLQDAYPEILTAAK